MSFVVHTAEIVLPCAELDDTLEFFTERLGFRVDMIMPADDPAVAVLSGHGLRLRLARVRSDGDGPDGDGHSGAGVLRLGCDGPLDGERLLFAPNGTRVELVPLVEAPLVLPAHAPSFELTRASPEPVGVGRAGMRYRDLLPGRQGGRFIASHILIPDGGPVPDYVHHHRIRFQVIYCARGWVRVVYEDQGPPFVLAAGDCVLQPPGIRHRVVESSPGVEVIELGCPAVHATTADHEMELPTPTLRPERSFEGQRFVRHEALDATWGPWRGGDGGFEQRDTGIGAATGGLAGVRVMHAARSGADTEPAVHDGELLFWFVLDGSATLRLPDRDEALGRDDAVAVPAGLRHQLRGCSPDLQLLEVTLPDRIGFAPRHGPS